MKKSRTVLFAISALAISSALAFTPVTMPTNATAHLGKHPKSSTHSLSDLSPLLHKKYVFTLKDAKSGSMVYSSRGEFMLNQENYIVQEGRRLQGYQEERTLVPTQCALSDIQLTPGLPPAPTTNFAASFNLNAAATTPLNPFKSDDNNTYNCRIDSAFFDKVGGSHDANFYFVKGGASGWDVYVEVDHQLIGKGSVSFDDAGRLEQVNGLSDLIYTSPINGSTQSFSLTLDGATQFASPFIVRNLSSDGHEPLELTDVVVDDLGFVNEVYTNGLTQVAARIAVSPLR